MHRMMKLEATRIKSMVANIFILFCWYYLVVGDFPHSPPRKVGSHQQKHKRKKPGVRNYLGWFASAYTAHQVNSLMKPIQFPIFLTAVC